MKPTIWIQVKQHDGFVVFRADDVHSIKPVLGKSFTVKYYYVSLKTSVRVIRLSIAQAERLTGILEPVNLIEETPIFKSWPQNT